MPKQLGALLELPQLGQHAPRSAVVQVERHHVAETAALPDLAIHLHEGSLVLGGRRRRAPAVSLRDARRGADVQGASVMGARARSAKTRTRRTTAVHCNGTPADSAASSEA